MVYDGTSWGIASFSNRSGGEDVSLKFTAARIASGGASYAYKWETSSPVTVRIGPPACDWEVQQVQNRQAQENSSGVLGWVNIPDFRLSCC